MKWVVFATAPDETSALMWRDIVRNAGVPCELRPGDVSSFLGVSATPVRLVTPEEHRDAALAALADVFADTGPDSEEEEEVPGE